jgi:Glycosyltransferase family 87
VGEAFTAFRRDRDRLGGIWLALLILKPQYLLLLLPVLLWKRRWGAIGGFTIGSLVIVGASALLVGPASVVGWIGSLVESATAAGGALITAVAPEVMVNWRSLVGAVPGGLSATLRLAITVVLSAATVAAVIYAWRGPWAPRSAAFAGQMTLLVAGTLLASYHSHIHGVSMIVVPLAAFLASNLGRDRVGRALDAAIRVDVAFAIVVPWLWFTVLDRGHVTANRLVAVALVAGFVLLFAMLERSRRPVQEATPVPDPAPA